MGRPPQEILIRPVITEKSSALQYDGTDATLPDEVRERTEVRPKYTFEVAPDATKVEVREAVEALFDVTVQSVRTMNVPGKKRRQGRSPMGRTPGWKKAIVEVAPGEMIDLFEGV